MIYIQLNNNNNYNRNALHYNKLFKKNKNYYIIVERIIIYLVVEINLK